MSSPVFPVQSFILEDSLGKKRDGFIDFGVGLVLRAKKGSPFAGILLSLVSAHFGNPVLFFKERTRFVVTLDELCQNFTDCIGVLEVPAGVHVVDQEPELDGRHAVTDEDTRFLGVFCFHLQELFAALLVAPRDVCITNTDCYSFILENPVNEFHHFLV